MNKAATESSLALPGGGLPLVKGSLLVTSSPAGGAGSAGEVAGGVKARFGIARTSDFTVSARVQISCSI